MELASEQLTRDEPRPIADVLAELLPRYQLSTTLTRKQRHTQPLKTQEEADSSPAALPPLALRFA